MLGNAFVISKTPFFIGNTRNIENMSIEVWDGLANQNDPLVARGTMVIKSSINGPRDRQSAIGLTGPVKKI